MAKNNSNIEKKRGIDRFLVRVGNILNVFNKGKTKMKKMWALVLAVWMVSLNTMANRVM